VQGDPPAARGSLPKRRRFRGSTVGGMTTKRLLLCCAVVLFAVTGCGGREARTVPDVAGERLDVAQEELDDVGVGSEVIGGGTFGVVVRSHWRVCEQHPSPGRVAKSVELVVARSCPGRHVPGTIPDVTGLRLDVAEDLLVEDDLAYDVYEEGLGDVVIESNWTVCSQYPDPGAVADEVELYVERSCEDDDD
jgi:beta-lactam-binding protein with PASTA domain